MERDSNNKAAHNDNDEVRRDYDDDDEVCTIHKVQEARWRKDKNKNKQTNKL